MKTHFYTRQTTSGDYIIYVRLIEGSKREAFSSGIKITPEKWNQKRQTIGGRELTDRQNHSKPERLKLKIYGEYDKLILQDNYTLARVKLAVTGKQESRQLLLEQFGKFIEDNEQIKDGMSMGTIKKYKTVQSHLRAFLKTEYGQDDLALGAINKAFVVRFWEYLRGTAQINQNTGAKYIRHVKKVFSSFVDKGYIDKHPFPNYSQRVIPEKKEFLMSEELFRIEELDITIERLELIRDAFLFSCYTGLAYTDLKNLSVDHLHDGVVRMIKIPRQKTGVDSTVPVLPKAQEIMDKYLEHPLRLRDGVIIPVPSNQKTNAYLKELADLARIKKNLTFHMARHTFGTTVTLSNDYPLKRSVV